MLSIEINQLPGDTDLSSGERFGRFPSMLSSLSGLSPTLWLSVAIAHLKTFGTNKQNRNKKHMIFSNLPPFTPDLWLARRSIRSFLGIKMNAELIQNSYVELCIITTRPFPSYQSTEWSFVHPCILPFLTRTMGFGGWSTKAAQHIELINIGLCKTDIATSYNMQLSL